MIILDQSFDLGIDRGAIKAHHKQLAKLPIYARMISQQFGSDVGRGGGVAPIEVIPDWRKSAILSRHQRNGRCLF